MMMIGLCEKVVMDKDTINEGERYSYDEGQREQKLGTLSGQLLSFKGTEKLKYSISKVWSRGLAGRSDLRSARRDNAVVQKLTAL